jgi:hypothetical protein
VIQECENPASVKEVDFQNWASNRLWTGSNDRKGLGIFADPKTKIELLDWKSGRLQHFIPCRVNSDFNLIAAWCHGASSRYAYIGQLWKYMQRHKLNFGKSVIAGDLNSNTFWDKKRRLWNHSEVVRVLKKSRIESLYHNHFQEEQGKEKQPTFYLYKDLSKPYHLDYVFASEEFHMSLKTVTIGDPTQWLHFSDHMPLALEV